MPKTRATNTIATRGGSSSSGSGSSRGTGIGAIGGAGGNSSGGMGNVSMQETEMADRLNERLEEARTIPVQMESRSRGGTETLQVTFDPATPGMASVYSPGSGMTYHVDTEAGTCTCPHNRFRNTRCRHMDAVDIARGQLVDQRTNVNSSEENMPIHEAVASRQRADIDDEERRRALSGNEIEDGYFYSDDISEFENNLREFEHQPLPYDYVNALNGNAATFGIELEFADGDSDAIARELYELGICGHPEMLPYHARGYNIPSNKWRIERDGSVTYGRRGGELVSPVLQDTPETWRAIEKICEVAKRHGARVNDTTGGHVHVGVDQLDTARQRWRRFFKGIAGNEEAIYRFSGGEIGRLRSGASHYAAPFEDRARQGSTRRQRIETVDDVNRMAEEISRRDRYYGINLTNIPRPGAPNTVEFRYFNGSLTPGQIQANIKVAAGIVNTAEKARTMDSDEFIVTDNQKRRGSMLNNVQNERSNKGMIKFLDTFFSRKKDKDHILGVLAKNRWR